VEKKVFEDYLRTQGASLSSHSSTDVRGEKCCPKTQATEKEDEGDNERERDREKEREREEQL
jgi:hypothetical protein